MPETFCLSVAIPIHNEETVLPDLLRRIRGVIDQIAGGPHEIVFVDDGSTDGSLQLLEEAACNDRRILVISLSRNFGHQPAISAALDHVSGDAVVVMDGDLQDTPEVIPQFVKLYMDNYDVVYATRTARKEPWLLRLCYFVFYRMMTTLSDVRLPVDAGDFGLMSRRVIDQLRQLPEHHRYLRGLRSWVGFRQVGVPVERAGRHSGKSKYSLLRLARLAADGIFSFSIVPIRAAAIFGAGAIFFSACYAVYALFAKFFMQRSPLGFTALIIMFIFLSGVNLLFLGIIGEYVGRIYEESKSRPLYVIGRVSGTIRVTTTDARTHG